jgi:hypothetical protein
MRKDVECTFGILKGRWRILKAGVRLRSAEAADNVWKTCCALHNWLLEVDGLDERWEQGVPSEWEGRLGEFDTTREVEERGIPQAIERLQNPSILRSYDTSDQGIRNSVQTEADSNVAQNTSNNNATTWDGVVHVRDLSLVEFRARLIEHFDILYEQHKIQWPQRNKQPQPV